MQETQRALSRALSFCCGANASSVDQFFQRAAWELHHGIESEVVAMAFVIKRGDGSCFVGRSREHHALPVETLLGMVVEGHGEPLTCRVRDHALDTVRFLDHRFRTSVVVRVEIPEMLAKGCDAALWFGLAGGAHPGFVTVAEAMGRDVGEWLLGYGSIIEAMLRMTADRERQTKRLEEMTSLIHDARAPLGVLTYMAREIESSDQVASFQHELDYLGAILAQGAPHSERRAQAEVCDVAEVIRRVYRRYAREELSDALTVEVGYYSLYGRCSPLELERIITNLVSNAQRHAPDGRIRIGAEERGDSVVVCVQDNGPGIPAAVLEALREGVALHKSSALQNGMASGWGIGLQSCIAKARSFGGQLSITSGDGEGTCVTVLVPRGEMPIEAQRLEVADGGVRREVPSEAFDVCIIDDDAEHTSSLGRLLRSFGFKVQQSSSLSAFLQGFNNKQVSSILCDAHMPDGGAERLLPLLGSGASAPRVGVVSGDASDDQLYRLAALGAQAFFTKPVDIDEVVAWVRAGR
ncbi:MAG: hypothetical protein RL518_1729 [Pseudomonadota bacterium]|jgi:signal transduction histidine kinase